MSHSKFTNVARAHSKCTQVGPIDVTIRFRHVAPDIRKLHKQDQCVQDACNVFTPQFSPYREIAAEAQDYLSDFNRIIWVSPLTE